MILYRRLAIYLASWLAAGAAASAADVFFLGNLNDPEDSFGTQINAVSADGSTVVGSTASPNGGEAFRWTAGEGMVGLGDLLGGAFASSAFGVSGDGSTIVGRGRASSFNSASGVDRAFRWTGELGMRQLISQEPNVTTNSATRAARDGLSVYGSGTRVTGPNMLQQEPIQFRWTEENDAETIDTLLPDFDWAFPISPGDNIWAGYSDFPVAMRQYALVDLSGDHPQVIKQFAPFPTNVFPDPAGVEYPVFATDDASIVFGRELLVDPADENHTLLSIFVEEEGTRTTIATAHNGMSITGATDDGEMLLGQADFQAFLWTRAGGVRRLQDYFVKDYGLADEFEDWMPSFFNMKMSADGQVIAGQGTDGDFQDHRIVVRLTDRLPGDANFDGRVDLSDFAILKSNFGSGMWWNQGNFDGDRDVDLDDFAVLKENFGVIAAAVPEPTAAALAFVSAALGGALLLRGRNAPTSTPRRGAIRAAG